MSTITAAELGLAAPAVFATPEDFGAYGNGAVTTGSMDIGSTTLTPTSGTFTVGQAVLVTGAGAGGDNLSTTVVSVSPNVTLADENASGAKLTDVTVVWGNDDTAAIIDAINALVLDTSFPDYGGRVVFSDGKLYIIATDPVGAASSGNAKDSLNYCSQVPLPAYNGFGAVPSIELCGSQPAEGSANVAKLVSFYVSADPTWGASVIGGPPQPLEPVGGASPFTQINAIIRNLQIVMPTNPSLRGLDLGQVSFHDVTGVDVLTHAELLYGTPFVQPTKPNGWGIVGAQIGDQPTCRVRDAHVRNCYVGIALGEQNTWDDITVLDCKVCWTHPFPTSYPSVIKRLNSYHNERQVQYVYTDGIESSFPAPLVGTHQNYQFWCRETLIEDGPGSQGGFTKVADVVDGNLATSQLLGIIGPVRRGLAGGSYATQPTPIFVGGAYVRWIVQNAAPETKSLTVTSGTAQQDTTGCPSGLVIQIAGGTSGTVTVAIGRTSSTLTNVITSLPAPANEPCAITLPLPPFWWFEITVASLATIDQVTQIVSAQ